MTQLLRVILGYILLWVAIGTALNWSTAQWNDKIGAGVACFIGIGLIRWAVLIDRQECRAMGYAESKHWTDAIFKKY